MININSKYQPIYYTKKRYIFLTGGRGSGKTFVEHDAVVRYSFEKNNNILFTRYTKASASKSIIPEFYQTIQRLNQQNNFDITQDKATNLISSNFIQFSGVKPSSLDQTANLKSLPNMATWVQEEGEDFTDEKMFDKIDDSIRTKECQNRVMWLQNPSSIHHFIYERFFKDTHKIIYIEGYPIQISTHPEVEHIHTTYHDVKSNLSESILKKIQYWKDKADSGDLKARHFYANNYLGQWVSEYEGAMWTIEMIDKNRVTKLPELKKIIVAVDPAVTSNEESDETGIVIVGLGVDGKAYILEDVSGKFTPDGWARRAVFYYHKYKANKIVAEVNQGGDLVKNIITNIDSSIFVDTIHACKGKFLRAEPVVALYEDGQVKHFNRHPELEEQMITWLPAEKSKKSPDRIDAMVYAVTDLLINNTYGCYVA